MLNELYNNITEVSKAYIIEGPLTGLLYVWHEGPGVNIHLPDEEGRPGVEVDYFTLYGDNKGGDPSLKQIMVAIAENEEDEAGV